MAGQDQAPKAVGQEPTSKDIEQAREDLARTIDAIADKVSPANVARRTAGELGNAARHTAGDVGNIARRTAGDLGNVARRTVGTLRQRAQSVDPKLAAAGAGVVVVAGAVAFVVWRRRR